MAREWTEEELKEAREHRDVVLALQAVLSTSHGKILFKYLFKSLDLGVMPELGLVGESLHDRLGFLRVGQEIFKLACEANVQVSSELLAQLEKERYDEKYREYLSE